MLERPRTDEDFLANSVATKTLLGNRPLRDLQKLGLRHMYDGKNTFCLFGTGQGKSVIFQIPAIDDALAGNKTIVFYPLRALANDQYEVFSEAVSELPIKILRANGSIGDEEREALDDALDSGEWDIIFATPEFVMHHSEKFAKPRNMPSRVVVDEAHHLYDSRHRPAYRAFKQMLVDLGSPRTAAFTATADRMAFDHIVDVLGIEEYVINPAVRANLKIVDARNTRNKRDYLEKLCGSDHGKTIVYCNSRKETEELAEYLAAKFDGIGFYNAKMPRKLRKETEDKFRSGDLRFMLATSAFGEGIDLSDVRHIVQWHINFDVTSFVQMSGRAGRDGRESHIHLLYEEKDKEKNEYIMDLSAPTLSQLRQIYAEFRKIGHLDEVRDELEIRGTYESIARLIAEPKIKSTTISVAARIFEQAGLAELGKSVVEGDEKASRYIRLIPIRAKVKVEDTMLYNEAQANIEAFKKFAEFVMKTSPERLEESIAKPIYPKDIPLTGSFERKENE